MMKSPRRRARSTDETAVGTTTNAFANDQVAAFVVRCEVHGGIAGSAKPWTLRAAIRVPGKPQSEKIGLYFISQEAMARNRNALLLVPRSYVSLELTPMGYSTTANTNHNPHASLQQRALEDCKASFTGPSLFNGETIVTKIKGEVTWGASSNHGAFTPLGWRFATYTLQPVLMPMLDRLPVPIASLTKITVSLDCHSATRRPLALRLRRQSDILWSTEFVEPDSITGKIQWDDMVFAHAASLLLDGSGGKADADVILIKQGTVLSGSYGMGTISLASLLSHQSAEVTFRSHKLNVPLVAKFQVTLIPRG